MVYVFGAEGSVSRLHILLVDDDVGCLRSLEDLLSQDGHQVSTATRGAEAVELARHWRRSRRPIELSILDFDVPDSTGIETYVRLRAEMPRIGAIFISGNSSGDLEERVLAAGGFAFVHKPLDVTRVRRTVSQFAVSHELS